MVTEALREELCATLLDCSMRGLTSTAKWCSEMIFGLIDSGESLKESNLEYFPRLSHHYICAKQFFDSKEYLRTAYILRDSTDSASIFMRNYALYLDGEKKLIEGQGNPMDREPGKMSKNKNLVDICDDLCGAIDHGIGDEFIHCLLGIALKALGKRIEAASHFKIALDKRSTLLWAIQEMTALGCSSNNPVNKIDLDAHISGLKDGYMKDLLSALISLEKNDNEETFRLLSQPKSSDLARFFSKSLYLKGLKASAKYNLREFDEAEVIFEEILAQDPFYLDFMDVYSNILYVKEERRKLSQLAHSACITDRLRPESSCIIGNYYSLRGEHEKAVKYFEKAILLDRNYLSAWTLMGHEYVEMKNTNGAIECYRKAVDINDSDYRAWYGLGQTYEVMRMPFYAIYYYQKATQLRPTDGRMWCALAGCYESLKRSNEAIQCYAKALESGDPEGLAMFRLGKLHWEIKDSETASQYFKSFIEEFEGEETSEFAESCLFLALYYKKKNRLNECKKYAMRLLELSGPEREEAKALLREIS